MTAPFQPASDRVGSINRRDPRHCAAAHRLHKQLQESGDKRLIELTYSDVLAYGWSTADFVGITTYSVPFREMLREEDADHHEPRIDA